MLSTVYAEEALFRRETEEQAHQFAILESIRSRKEALATAAKPRTIARPALAWPRPIGVKLEVASSNVACA